MKKIMKTQERKNLCHHIRMTAGESESVAELAKASGLSISEFFRRAALGREVHAPRPLPEVNRAVYSELGRVSGNLQRLFTVLTTDRKLPPDIAKQLAAGVGAVKKVCQQTQQQIVGGGQHDL